jgi:hypothetical protein
MRQPRLHDLRLSVFPQLVWPALHAAGPNSANCNQNHLIELIRGSNPLPPPVNVHTAKRSQCLGTPEP